MGDDGGMIEGVDTLIVGAGSAGCVLAARLSEDPSRRVLLLEAGPDYRAAELPDELRLLSKAIAWPHDWGDQVESIRGRQLKYARGRGTGGSSSTNGGVAMRAEPPDFDSWPVGWRFTDLLPYFCRLERDEDFPTAPYHGADGPIPIIRWRQDEWAPLQTAFVEGCRAIGFEYCPDHNAPGTTGVGPIPMNRVGRGRISTSIAYLEPARGRPNLAVRGDAHVRRVIIERGRATGVELIDGEIIAAGEVVLASGVVQNPLLLWRSGIGPIDGVHSIGVDPVVAAPHVGANVTDHYVVTYAHPIDPTTVPDDAPSIQTITRVTAPGSDRTHDVQLTPFARRHPDGRRDMAISVSLQLPDGAGTVTPTSADPAAPARIVWPFAGIAENVRRIREGWRLAARATEASGIAIERAELARTLALRADDIDEHIAEEHTAFYHGVGTCRMGEHDASVVDPELRVRGVEGLRIVDASVIPTVPRSNTNIVVIALAERAAELLAARRVP
jgi:choline dehydrogenase